jgi:hypothetical protein
VCAYLHFYTTLETSDVLGISIDLRYLPLP